MAPSRKFASFIFRSRGIYLLLALALSMFFKYRAQGNTPLPLFLAGVAIALGTQVFRTYAAGYLWGRQAVSEVGADFLCASGPCAHTRNPLIPHEEEFLRKKFGRLYGEYAANTGRLFPRFPA